MPLAFLPPELKADEVLTWLLIGVDVARRGWADTHLFHNVPLSAANVKLAQDCAKGLELMLAAAPAIEKSRSPGAQGGGFVLATAISLSWVRLIAERKVPHPPLLGFVGALTLLEQELSLEPQARQHSSNSSKAAQASTTTP